MQEQTESCVCQSGVVLMQEQTESCVYQGGCMPQALRVTEVQANGEGDAQSDHEEPVC
jgi:hypothetical protein